MGEVKKARKINKRDRQTKEELARQLMSLMLKKSVDNIRIAEIVEPLGYSRQTFYHHFQDKYDLVDWIYRNQIMNFMTLIGEDYPWIQAVIAKNEIIYKNQSFFKKACQEERFIESFTEITKRLYFDEVRKNTTPEEFEEVRFSVEFYAMACVKKTAEWAITGCKTEPDKLAVDFLICLPENVRRCLLTEKDWDFIRDHNLA